MEKAKQDQQLKLVKIVFYYVSAIKTMITFLIDVGFSDKKKMYYFITCNSPILQGQIIQKHYVPARVNFEIIALVSSDAMVRGDVFSDMFKNGYYESTERVEVRIVNSGEHHNFIDDLGGSVASEQETEETDKQIRKPPPPVVDIDALRARAAAAVSDARIPGRPDGPRGGMRVLSHQEIDSEDFDPLQQDQGSD